MPAAPILNTALTFSPQAPSFFREARVEAENEAIDNAAVGAFNTLADLAVALFEKQTPAAEAAFVDGANAALTLAGRYMLPERVHAEIRRAVTAALIDVERAGMPTALALACIRLREATGLPAVVVTLREVA